MSDIYKVKPSERIRYSRSPIDDLENKLQLRDANSSHISKMHKGQTPRFLLLLAFHENYLTL